MAVFTLLESNNLMLKVPLSKCRDDLDREQLKIDLTESMEKHQGIGLSANQIGIMQRVFIMYSDIKKRETMICFNPKIISYSNEKVLMQEGCLTYPGLWLKVKRPDGIEVEYEDEKGKKHEKALFGLECRIFQHEYDHMEGTDFTKKVSRLRLDMGKRRQMKQLKLAKKLSNHY